MNHILSRGDSLKQLTSTYGMSHAQAVNALAIADHMGVTAQSCGFKTVTIRDMRNGKEQYKIDDGIPVEAVGRVPGKRYNRGEKQGDRTHTNKKEATMAGKGRTAPVESEQNGEQDLTVYAEKEITPTMVDFHEWLEQETGAKLDLRSVALGGTLRMIFQQSDFNKERRAARQAEKAEELEAARAEREQAKAERAAAKAEKAAASDEPKPTPKGRGKAAGGTTGKRAGTPATGRGRGRAKATAGAGPAPF